MTGYEVLSDLDSEALSKLVQDVGIPPRPSLLADMQVEVQRDEPRMRVMVDIAGADVAMSAALLKTANSPMMGLRRRAETVQEAFTLLGYNQCHVILTEITLRDMFPPDGLLLTRFWDVSTKRAHAMTHLARIKGISSPALAHTLGLFVDIGIPVLIKRFKSAVPSYVDTLGIANESADLFTSVERHHHATDHALVGTLMARSWGVSQTVQLAIRMHHDYSGWRDGAPVAVLDLMALYLVSERIIQTYLGQNRHCEWDKGGARAMEVLGIDELALEAWTDEIHDVFDHVQ